MERKLLSIIVPSYNMEAYLPQCLNSLVISDKSLFEKLEVVVVNDGSKDCTGDIAQSYAQQYPGVFKVVNKPNGHYGSCINAALKVLTGEYVKILDADDSFDSANFEVWMKTVLARWVSGGLALVDMLLTDYVKVDEKGAVTSHEKLLLPRNKILSADSIPAYYVYPMHAIAYRADMLRQMNYRQTEGIMYTDTEWSVYPMSRVRNFYYCPLEVYRYLIAREGQSMDPNVFMKGMGQRIQMFVKMMQESLSIGWDNRSRYRMRFQSLMGIGALYKSCLGMPAPIFNERMLMVDSLLSDIGKDVYAEYEEIPLTRLNKYKFIKKWRRHKHLSTWEYYFVKLSYGIEKKLQTLKTIVKKIGIRFKNELI